MTVLVMCASGCMDLVPKQQNHGGFSAFHCVISFSHAHYVGKQKSREETLIRRSRIESGIYSSWPHICCHCRNNFPVSWVFCAQNCNTEKLFSGRKHSSCEQRNQMVWNAMLLGLCCKDEMVYAHFDLLTGSCCLRKVVSFARLFGKKLP